MHLNPSILNLSEARETLPHWDKTSLPHHDNVQQTHKHTCICTFTKSLKCTDCNPRGGWSASSTSQIGQILVYQARGDIPSPSSSLMKSYLFAQCKTIQWHFPWHFLSRNMIVLLANWVVHFHSLHWRISINEWISDLCKAISLICLFYLLLTQTLWHLKRTAIVTKCLSF